MINFFRKIRQQMAYDNKPGKYLRYAIGEIVLVVIGILIALQINSWNEQRKLNIEEQYLLKELLDEFTTNLEKVREDIFLNTNNQNASIQILGMIHDKSLKDRTNELDSLFTRVFSYGSFDASTGTLDEIINAGKLKAIRDKSLRKMLTQWPGIIRNQQEDIDIRRDQNNFYVAPFFVKNAPFKNGDVYIDFSHWSKKYKRKTLKDSNFDYNIEALISKEFEGVLYKFVLDQDYVLLNDVETEAFILDVIHQIKINIKHD